MHPILTEREQSTFWQQLADYVKHDALVPVVGVEMLEFDVAGGTTENLYTLVARELAQTTEVEPPEQVGMAAVNEVACRYLEKTRAGNARPEMLSALRAVQAEHGVPPALAKVASLPLRLFVTTTCDDLLAQAIEQARPEWQGKVQRVHYSPDLPEQFTGPSADGAPVVFHLFGRAESMSQYAITDEDVLEFMVGLQSHDTSPQELLREVRRKNLLFLGCGFPDWLARFFIRLGRPTRFSNESNKMDWLVDSTSGDTRFVTFLESFSRGMKCFPLTPREFVAKLDACPALSNLTSRPPPSRPPPRDPDRDILPGAVFLSYAIEDQAMAERIAEALDRHHIDCWFDKQQLMGGDDWEDKIRRNVQACRVFMPIISAQTTTWEPRFFRHEWEEAVTHRPSRRPDARFFLPVCLDGMTVEDESVRKYGFGVKQTLQLARDGEVGRDFLEAVTRAYRQAQLENTDSRAAP